MFSVVRKFVDDLCALTPRMRPLLSRILGLTFVFELLKIGPPFLFKFLIDAVTDSSAGFTPTLVVWLVLGYAGSLVLMGLIDVVVHHVGEKGFRDVEEEVALGSFSRIMALDMRYHEDRGTGTSVTKLIKGQDRIIDLLYNLLDNLLPVVFQAVFTLIVLLILDWRAAIVFLIFTPIFTWLVLDGARKTQEIRTEYNEHHEAYAGAVTQAIANVRTVKDFAAEEHEHARAATLFTKYRDAVERRVRVGLRELLIQDTLGTFARAATLGLGVYLLHIGAITAGSLVLLVSLSEKAFLNLGRLSRAYFRIQEAEPSLQRLNELQHETIEVRDNPTATHVITEGEVRFDHVTFSYGSKTDALKDVSFRIKPRQTVAIVGRSGSGKTTLVKLLLRLSDPTKGHVLVDGVATDAYSLAHLRGGMAIVAQDVELFNDTVRANIAYGAPHVSKQDVERVARLAYAHDFIMKLPHGYDTIVGERGVKLSGGQKQRIAIARALVRNPHILIFDEATSSLDAESERLIHDAIFHLQGKLTLIIIAHRFSTIEHADTIVLLENGHVAEMGTHAQLVKKKGIFAKLRKLQELR